MELSFVASSIQFFFFFGFPGPPSPPAWGVDEHGFDIFKGAPRPSMKHMFVARVDVFVVEFTHPRH